MLRGMTIRTLKKALISESNSETIADNLQKQVGHWNKCIGISAPEIQLT